MRVSVIIPVLNSHEVVRRQILHFERMNLPDDVEIIIMDDGSDPPLKFDTDVVTIHQTNETRPWTSSIARNRGAEIAKGRNLIMADVGYIIPKKMIMEVHEFTGQKMQCIREFGVLDENGCFTQDRETLLDYGLLPARYERRGATIPPHPNVYAMNRDIFLELGGYNEGLVLRRQYPQGEDNLWKHVWAKWQKAGKGQVDEYRPTVYMFPRGQFCGDVDYNPHNLFHGLTRKTRTNVFWHRQLRREAKAK